MSTVPVGDIDILAMSPQQFFQLMEEDRPASLSGPRASWGRAPAGAAAGPCSTRPGKTSIFPVNPFDAIDHGNEWLKDHTYVDMFGWKDAILDGRTAIKQVALLGILGDAYLTKTRADKEVVIFKGYAGLREKLPGTRYLRENPIVHAADLVIGHKEMLEEAGKATRIAIVCFIAWDIVHECLQDKPDMTRLGVSILSDVFQTVSATYIGAAIGIAFGAMFGGVVITFIVAAVATLGVGLLFTGLDKRYELTEKAVAIAKGLKRSAIVSDFVEFAQSANREYFLSHSSPMAYMVY